MDKQTLKENQEKLMSKRHYKVAFHIGGWTPGTLDEGIVTAEIVHKFKEKLDEIRYGARSLCALLEH